ncbi:putative GTP-binding protein 6, partial [Mustela nigripes]|uniref:putative GTP-binding protein 6 n=1 Tax=Mustela nigripes TaxID=77151 RepID=UPI0028161CFA
EDPSLGSPGLILRFSPSVAGTASLCRGAHGYGGAFSPLCTLHEAVPAKGHGPGQARQGWTGPGAHGDVSLTLALCLLKAEWQVAEAEALVQTLDGWSVVESMVVPSKTPDGKLTFGKGTLEHLTERVRGLPEITAVFLNVERLATPTKKELEARWGVPVFDRFTVVLHIFRCNARTKEAHLQVALAELPLLRSRLKSSTARPDAQGWGSRYIMGSGNVWGLVTGCWGWGGVPAATPREEDNVAERSSGAGAACGPLVCHLRTN